MKTIPQKPQPKSQAQPKEALTLAQVIERLISHEPYIQVRGYAYWCDYDDSLPRKHRYHLIRKNRTCDCPLGSNCPAVGWVGKYLSAGGQRAGDPPEDYWDTLPEVCPTCGAETEPDHSLDCKAHGVGWRCKVGGAECYWGARVSTICKAKQTRDESDKRLYGERYLFPPKSGYAGVKMADYLNVRVRKWGYIFEKESA